MESNKKSKKSTQKIKKHRCFVCRRKISPMYIEMCVCKCSRLVCTDHVYPFHDCLYKYKNKNPLIGAAFVKVQKI